MPLFRAALVFVLALTMSATAHAAPRETMMDVGDGVKLSVLTAGAGADRPAVALITGWRVTKDAWRPQLAALSTDRQVIAFDPRSQGASTITGEGVTPEQRARDLQAR